MPTSDRRAVLFAIAELNCLFQRTVSTGTAYGNIGQGRVQRSYRSSAIAAVGRKLNEDVLLMKLAAYAALIG